MGSTLLFENFRLGTVEVEIEWGKLFKHNQLLLPVSVYIDIYNKIVFYEILFRMLTNQHSSVVLLFDIFRMRVAKVEIKWERLV